MRNNIYIKLSEGYVNQFLTTIKGNVFYKEKVTKYDGDDDEVELLLEQGILTIVEDVENKEIHKQQIVKNDMHETNKEYAEMLKEDKRKAKEEAIKRFEEEEQNITNKTDNIEKESKTKTSNEKTNEQSNEKN